ncbi:hypothetical protein KR059_008756 [Drosophila kikkawai]|nr:hypothetical protein KR059_008756 [Drosophila kikkawai]
MIQLSFQETCTAVLLLLLILHDHIDGFKFILLHTNDMHARYDSVSAKGGKCKPEDDRLGYCYGGFGRVATALDKYRQEERDPVLYLNGGDTFHGTPWYTIYQGKMVAQMLNMLAPDAMSLGVHEFDDGTEVLAEFIDLIKFPVVSCNLKLINEPKLEDSKNLKNFTIIKKGDRTIGIVGYIHAETKERTQPNNIIFQNEIPAINKAARKLTELGVNIIIALGHSGYKKDIEIAKMCPEVDVVVGGQSHTFLFTGRAPGKDIPEGPYPTIVVKPDGRKVPVVQAYAYTKYLGRMSLEFDKAGNLLNFKGEPILLDSRFKPKREIQDLLSRHRQVIDDMERHVVGTTSVYLNGDRNRCGYGECNFGNIIADSFVYARVQETLQDSSMWTDAPIGIINAGAIRASIDPGIITEADVITVMPFSNGLFHTRINGLQLMKALEHSAQLRSKNQNSGFLQVSGLRVKFNYTRPMGQRITEIKALCSDCQIPKYESVKTDQYYGVVLPSFLLNGGEGYSFVDKQNPQVYNMSLLERTAFIRYLQEHKIVYPERQERMTEQERYLSSKASSFLTQLLLELFAFLCFLYCFYLW